MVNVQRSPFNVQRRLPALKTQWDSTRVYPVCVVLVSFSDRQFSGEEPWDRYNRIFNEEGYNEGAGPGSVADYFVRQSEGWFHPRFDVYGPVPLTNTCTANGNYGSTAFRTALQTLADSLSLDFSPYDWDADGKAEHVVFIYAGMGGNEFELQNKGYIWPNTSSFSALAIGDTRASSYSASAELWSNGRSCGIGTICHEFSHTLGLPDIYPTSSSNPAFSIADEWDLMDGGNFINNGWCPCNYSAYEKHLLGWLELEELTDYTKVERLLPISEGGRAYVIRHTSKELLVIENRQWTGWDLRTPGRGLLIAHIDDMASAGNAVNNDPKHLRYDYFHADNLSYSQWADIVEEQKLGRTGGHSPYLSGTAYPCVNDSVDNHVLTPTSVPAAEMFNPGADGTSTLALPITDIVMDDDPELGGVLTFTVGADLNAINDVQRSTFFDERSGKAERHVQRSTFNVQRSTFNVQRIYDLSGRPLHATPARGQIYLVRHNDGTVTKHIF